MISTLRSIWIWTSAAALILAWLPVLAVIRLFDRDPTRYKTGRMFRELGVALTKVSTSWKLLISGERIADPRRPYVVVCNHQSFADIPLISNLPWEMKWLAKALLFRLPVVGWMLKMAGDIPVERGDRVKGAQSILQAARYLEQHCS
ncbi:MAG: 1-acyl-sn-glycerol-3-phosphate acyltransferase, partial [Ignavibacteriae bacterium]|nr:1-acyl-sn-glycerol-3-phosphate acyltransferase [Ignavibacteriota bacterium]